MYVGLAAFDVAARSTCCAGCKCARVSRLCGLGYARILIKIGFDLPKLATV